MKQCKLIRKEAKLTTMKTDERLLEIGKTREREKKEKLRRETNREKGKKGSKLIEANNK